ncbi:hypothetical protein SteCoe_10997 [Stentor coeruleus]|uniref:DNA mismatch repair proteins mutS family domain-containing protein n=1 Tax=Stentor coeruleus TaxID=5963 RepID=A0A1R2CE84_9CILI|nr:hypothetical protein SteCoe_10997 [Stentor coeruleus]
MLITPRGSQPSKRTPSTSKDKTCMMSIIENRSREVGIAYININSFEIFITQYVDNIDYFHTLSLIYNCDPVEILMCKTAEESLLTHRIHSHLNYYDISFLSRKLFDEIKGEQLCLGSLIRPLDQDIQSKYVCLAALSALISHIELIQNANVYKDRLKINLIYLKNFLIIDCYTIKALEIMTSAEGVKKDALVGLFDCKTQAGSRILRASLLQPNKEPKIVNTRLSAVEELINNSVARVEIKNCLGAFVNTELATSKILQQPKQLSEKYMRSQITNILNIFHNLEQCKNLYNILIKTSLCSKGFKELIELLDDRQIDSLYDDIINVLSDTVVEKKIKKVTIFDCLFLVKEGRNVLLDISRQAYNKYIEEIHKLECQYRCRLSDSNISIIYTPVRGYHLQLDSSVLHRNYYSLLGEHLLKITHKEKKCFATTYSLLHLNEKIKSSQTEIINRTYSVIEELCAKARDKIICLYNISQAVATLDLYLAFSVFSITYECSKPIFKEGKIKIVEGKNPLLICKKDIKSNDYKFSRSCCLQVLTGANSSGKTTYLKTLALLSILSHSGCFVPVKKFVISPLSYILTRIGDKESIELNSSSFVAEMYDCRYILNTCNSESLVLLDELGKSTSTQDGIALAWAICEKLFKTHAFTLVATHFHQLSLLESLNPCIINIHIENYVVSLGPASRTSGYGIELALQSALPQNISIRAQKFLHDFEEIMSRCQKQALDCKEKKKMKLVEELVKLKKAKISKDQIKLYLLKLKEEFC